MRTLIPALTLMAAGLVPLSAAPPAGADTATCQGQPATIVGSGGAEIVGTEGPDVMVSNGSSVRSLGGDDLICMTNVTGNGTTAFAGPGDDSVTVRNASPNSQLATYLEQGNDTFTGGTERDVLPLTFAEDDQVPRGGNDSIQTKGGKDFVAVGDRQTTTPETDRVALGAGKDMVRLYDTGIASLRLLSGGTGKNTVYIDAFIETHDLTVDAAHRRIVRGDDSFQGYTGFRRFRVNEGGNLRFEGTGGADTLHVERARKLVAVMGAGSDNLQVDTTSTDGTKKVLAKGQGGSDHLSGSRGNDTLLGGGGFDVVNGQAGNDTCTGERQQNCEG